MALLWHGLELVWVVLGAAFVAVLLVVAVVVVAASVLVVVMGACALDGFLTVVDIDDVIGGRDEFTN